MLRQLTKSGKLSLSTQRARQFGSPPAASRHGWCFCSGATVRLQRGQHRREAASRPGRGTSSGAPPAVPCRSWAACQQHGEAFLRQCSSLELGRHPLLPAAAAATCCRHRRHASCACCLLIWLARWLPPLRPNQAFSAAAAPARQQQRRALAVSAAASSAPAADFRQRAPADVRVLVVGATGYIGKFVVKELVKRGYNVVAFARERSGIGGKQGAEDVRAEFPGAGAQPQELLRPAAAIDGGCWATCGNCCRVLLLVASRLRSPKEPPPLIPSLLIPLPHPAEVRFGDVMSMESLSREAFKEPVDVVVSCLASRTGALDNGVPCSGWAKQRSASDLPCTHPTAP